MLNLIHHWKERAVKRAKPPGQKSGWGAGPRAAFGENGCYGCYIKKRGGAFAWRIEWAATGGSHEFEMHAALAETCVLCWLNAFMPVGTQDPNSDQILKELRALPDKWLKDRKNHSERCAFTPPVVPNNIFDERKNLVQSTNTASFGVFEYCFDSFDAYIKDVHELLSKYGYDQQSGDVSEIDKFFGVAFTDMADWPSDKSAANEN